MSVACFFDYTCGYSFRMWRWLEGQVRWVNPEVDIDWSTFSLKEVNRTEGETVFDETDEPSLSIVALALSIAAREADFPTYHSATFQAFHEPGPRVTRDDLLRFAQRAGVDVEAFWDERAGWIAAVAAGHRGAADQRGVFGTPTLVLGGSAVYLKMAEVPASPDEGVRLWDALNTLVVAHPEMIEIKRPSPRK